MTDATRVTAPDGTSSQIGRRWLPDKLLIVVVLLLGGIVGRLLFRRPSTIRARADNGRELTWRAAGVRRSGRVRNAAAAALARRETDARPNAAVDTAYD